MDGETLKKVGLPVTSCLGDSLLLIALLFCLIPHLVLTIQVVELWAKEARRLSSMPEETGDVHGHSGRKEDEKGMNLAYTLTELGLLDTSVLDDFGETYRYLSWDERRR
jgi:hypothetical protein